MHLRNSHKLVATQLQLVIGPKKWAKIESKTRIATRDAWRGKTHLEKAEPTQQTADPAPPTTRSTFHKFPAMFCSCCGLCYSPTNFFVCSICWHSAKFFCLWSNFADFVYLICSVLLILLCLQSHWYLIVEKMTCLLLLLSCLVLFLQCALRTGSDGSLGGGLLLLLAHCEIGCRLPLRFQVGVPRNEEMLS